jgi:hypothetical protein
MDRTFLEGLGLSVAVSAAGVMECSLTINSGEAINPLTRKLIDAVSFTVVGDRLLYVSPAEFVGAQPINLAFLTAGTHLEDLVVKTLNEHLMQLERRSSELGLLGISPTVDAGTLQLSAELVRAPFKFVITANRAGQFRVLRAFHADSELTAAAASTFELSEFRDRTALEEFLYAMYSDIATASPPRASALPTPAPGNDVTIPVKQLVAAFGDAVIPPRSALEIFAELRVDGEVLRFAAARVQGKSFRGLLAGPKGKLWADRFDLEGFPGVRKHVAKVLGVPESAVEVLGA